MRAWVHENTHGIARRSSMPVAAAAPAAGREPSRRREISSTGVTAAKNAEKSGSLVHERAVDARSSSAAIRSMTPRSRRAASGSRPRRRRCAS